VGDDAEVADPGLSHGPKDTSIRAVSAPVQAPSSVPARTPVLADLGMLAVVLIWGLNFSVTKGAFDTFPPLAFTAVRFAIASVVLVLLVRRVEGTGRLPDGALVRLVVLGVVGNTLYQIAFISGLARTSASNSALILAAMPPVTAVAAAALGVDPVRPRILAGVLLATVGVALVVMADAPGLSGGRLTGDLLSLAAVVCWAAYTIGLRRVPPEVSPLRVTSITTVAGMPGLLLAGTPELMRMDWGQVGSGGWAALVYATVFSLLVAYVLWNRSVAEVGPSRTVIYMCLTPLVAVAGATVMLHEHPEPLQGVGAILILSGVLVARRA
jgi:Permeases of the drug/metabolite transporter (DMT) superfamily